MSRLAPLVKINDEIKHRIQAAKNAQFYVLQELGPMAFVLRQGDSDEKFKIGLGSLQSCNCSRHRSHGYACVHIVF